MSYTRWELTLDHRGNCLTITRSVLTIDQVVEHLTVHPGPFDELGFLASKAAIALDAQWLGAQLPLWPPATAPW